MLFRSDGTGAETLDDCHRDGICEEDATRNGRCYCGKVRAALASLEDPSSQA